MITPTERRLEPLEDQVGVHFVNRQEELALFLNDGIARINVAPNNSWALIERRGGIVQAGKALESDVLAE